MNSFSSYDRFVINEIARNIESPNPMQKVLDLTGKPVSKLMDKLDSKVLRKITTSIDSAIETGLRKSIHVGRKLTRDNAIRKEYKKLHNTEIDAIEDVRLLSLRQMDTVADTFKTSNSFFVGIEGAAMGIITTLSADLLAPATIAADVTASVTLMSRHVVQVAGSYGYSLTDPSNIIHILSSMVPLRSSQDEGFIKLKLAATEELRATQIFARGMTGKAGLEVVEKTCPKLIQLIHAIAQRLGLVLTQKELGMIIPGLGALINGSLNVAFQRMNHTNAKDYFRKMYLDNKYGREVVDDAIDREIHVLRTKAN